MSVYLRRLKRMLKHNPISELFPVRDYLEDEQVFVLDGPSIGAMLICQPTNGVSDEIKNTLQHLYQMEMPKGSTIQATLVSLPDIEDQLYGYRAIRGSRAQGEDREKIEAIATAAHDFFETSTREPVNDKGFIFRDYEFWFTVKVPIKDAFPSSKELADFNEVIKSVLSSLSVFHPQVATDADWWRRMHVLLNMYDGEYIGTPKHKQTIPMDRDLRDRALEDGKRVSVTNTGIDFYNHFDEVCQHTKTMTIAKLPDAIGYGLMHDLIGDWQRGMDFIDTHFMLTLNIVVPDQLKEKQKLLGKRNFVTNQARGAVIKYLDKLRYQKHDLDTVMTELEQEGATLARYSLQMMVFGRNEQKVDASCKKIIAFMRVKNIAVTMDSHFTAPNFISILPFGLHEEYTKHSRKFMLTTSKALPFFTPHIASYKGNTPYPVLQFVTRLGQLVNIDLFKSETNYNMACAAASGSGKSFLTGYIVNGYLNSGVKIQRDPDDRGLVQSYNDAGQVFIMDVGYSYKGLAEQYSDSQYLEFGDDFKYSLNPFPAVDQMGGAEGQAGMISSIIKVMASPNGTVSNYQNAEILVLLDRLWAAKGTEATITDFQILCFKHDSQEMNMIGSQLSPFCEETEYGGKGVYADLFSNKRPPVSYDSRLVVCELERIKGSKHLQVVTLMTTIMAIQKKMFLGGTRTRSLFVLEEAWEWISPSNTTGMFVFFADFLEAGWRRFRKANAAGICVTQSVMDYYESPLGRAIIENSSWFVLLKQKAEAIEKLEESKMYSGSKTDFHLMRSLRKVTPNNYSDEAFSEIILKNDGVGDLVRLIASRKMQLILTTEPNEKAERQELIDSGMSFNEAIDHLLAKDEEKKRLRKAS